MYSQPDHTQAKHLNEQVESRSFPERWVEKGTIVPMLQYAKAIRVATCFCSFVTDS
jgi:hypothetical protein